MQISFIQGPSERPRPPPYRILVLAPFDPEGQDRRIAPQRVARGTLATVLEQVAPQLTLDIENLLTAAGGTWRLTLCPRAFIDLSPQGLIRQIPELGWIDALRQCIAAVAAGDEPPERLRTRLADYAGVSGLQEVLDLCRQATTGPPPNPLHLNPARSPNTVRPREADEVDEVDEVERIFDLVEVPAGGGVTTPPTPGRTIMAGIISTLATPSSRRPHPALAAALAGVTDLLARQLQPIFAHPRLRTFEAAWRGLRFLLQGIGPGSGVEVLIRSTERERVVVDLQQAVALVTADDDSGPLDLVLIDLPFALDEGDQERLATLAELAAEVGTPLLVSLEAGFFAADGARPPTAIQDAARLLEGPAFTKWNVRRSAAAFGWVAACFNDFVLREPHRPGQPHSAGIAEAGPVLQTTLWGHAAWLVARRIAEQCQQNGGWPAPLIGEAAGPDANLTLIAPGDRPDAAAQRPLRQSLSNDQCVELGNAGILCLSGADNRDAAWILAAPSLLRVPSLTDRNTATARRRDSSLTARLVRTRVLHCLRAALDAVATAREPDPRTIEEVLNEWLSVTGSGALARVTRTPERPDELAIHLEIGERVLPGLHMELVLGTSI